MNIRVKHNVQKQIWMIKKHAGILSLNCKILCSNSRMYSDPPSSDYYILNILCTMLRHLSIQINILKNLKTFLPFILRIPLTNSDLSRFLFVLSRKSIKKKSKIRVRVCMRMYVIK